jgi:hypothetical protein
MKKSFFYIQFITFIFSSCEKDDICLLPTTPKLILRFYDTANQTEFKSPTSLSIWAEGKDTLSTYTNVALESIAIPLNTNGTQTVYNFKTSATGNIADNKYNTLTINYTTEEIFVSRSCGLKSIFNTVTITSDNGWFQSFTPNSLTTIDNETSAHVKIYH